MPVPSSYGREAAYARHGAQGLLAFISDGLTWNLGRAAAVHPGMNGASAPREARRIAEQLADVVAKHTMLEIANSYDALAVLKSASSST